MDTLRSHIEMIDLNPLVEERHPIQPPSNATPEEFQCLWYQITDRINYLPGGMISGKVSYNACFHDLEWGVQTHCYAPMGLDIKGKWTLGGSLPGEPIAPVELGVGAPLHGLYLREDVDMRCNVMMTSFVKKTTKKAHSCLVERLLVKASILNASIINQQLASKVDTRISQFSNSQATTAYSPSEYPETPIEDLSNHSAQSLRRMGTTASNDTRFGDHPSLYPKPLSGRNSVVSGHNSTYSQNGRDSYQTSNGSVKGQVTWQALNQSRNSATSQFPSQLQQQQHAEPVRRYSPTMQHQQLSQPSSRSGSPSRYPQNVSPQLQHQQVHHSPPTQINFAKQGGPTTFTESANADQRNRIVSGQGQYRAELE